MVGWCSNICLRSALPAVSLALMSCFPPPLRDSDTTALGLSQPWCSLASLAAFPSPAPGPTGVDDVWWHFVALLQPCQSCHTSLWCQLQPPNGSSIFEFIGKRCSWVRLCPHSLGECRGSSLELFAEPFTRSWFPHPGCSLNLGRGMRAKAGARLLKAQRLKPARGKGKIQCSPVGSELSTPVGTHLCLL